jgi:hypothetical protein
VEAATALVDTVKFALVAPDAAVTLVGTVATAVSLLESVTTAPPAGAASLRVTVPVEGVPPVTLVGLRLNEERVTGVAVWVTVSTAEVVSLTSPPKTTAGPN